jgi:hypothetical protein
MTKDLFDTADNRKNTQYDAEITAMYQAGLNGYRITRNLWKANNGVKVIAYNTVYNKIKQLKDGKTL